MRQIVFWTSVAFAILATAATCPFLLYGFPKTANEFGDAFGFFNAVVSAMAFVGLIVTLSLQRAELALQRQELQETREELRRTADAEKQIEQLHFVSTYLTMLNIKIQNENAESVSSEVTDPRAIPWLMIFKRKKEDLMCELDIVLERLRPFSEVAIPLAPPLVAVDRCLYVFSHFAIQGMGGSMFSYLIQLADWTRFRLMSWKRVIAPPETNASSEFAHRSIARLLELLDRASAALPGYGVHSERTNAYFRVVEEMLEVVSTVRDELDKLLVSDVGQL